MQWLSLGNNPFLFNAPSLTIIDGYSRKRILDILSSELSEIHLPKVLGRVTKAQLESLLSHLKDKWPLIQKKGAILQIIIAAVESLDEM